MTDANIEVNHIAQEAVAPAPKRTGHAKTKKIIGKAIIYVVLIAYALIIILPFLTVLLTALKTSKDATHIPFLWIPEQGLTLEGFRIAITENPQMNAAMPALIQGFFNTLLYVIPPTVIGLFTSSLSAYAFAKLRFRAKGIMYTMLLATMMIPGMIMLAPQLLVYDAIGWTGTPLPLMIPGMFGAAACVFFMRQFFTGISDSILEAAKIDGLGIIGIFFRIIVPLSVPALLAQGLLGFVGGYNDFLAPLIYLDSAELQTLQIALRTMASTHADDPNVVMSCCLVALLPMLIIYFICQKFFISGVITSGLKD